MIAAVAVPAGLALRSGGAAATYSGDALAIVSLDSGKLEGSVALASRPGDVAVDARDGSLWVTFPDRGVVQQIDPATKSVRDTIPVGADPGGIAIGDGLIWVSNGGSSTVSRISPDTNAVVDTVDVPGGPAGIAVDQHGVWVADSFNASVSQIDPVNGTVKATIPVGDHPVDVAVDGAERRVGGERRVRVRIADSNFRSVAPRFSRRRWATARRRSTPSPEASGWRTRWTEPFRGSIRTRTRSGRRYERARPRAL